MNYVWGQVEFDQRAVCTKEVPVHLFYIYKRCNKPNC